MASPTRFAERVAASAIGIKTVVQPFAKCEDMPAGPRGRFQHGHVVPAAHQLPRAAQPTYACTSNDDFLDALARCLSRHEREAREFQGLTTSDGSRHLRNATPGRVIPT
jgi:hypothetical protein